MQVEVGTSVGYALKRAQTALHAALDAGLRELDLSVSQYSCLELLRQRPDLTNAELARGAFVTRQAMHQLLGGLRTAGLVAGTGEGRNERIALTPTGLERLERASVIAAAVEQRMLSSLTGDDRRRMHEHLIACVDALA